MNRKLQKVIILVFIFSTMAGLFSSSVPAVASSGTFQTTAKVNLRSEPTTESTVITLVNSGTNVDVLNHDPAGWSRVTVGGTTGFIRSDYLKFPTGGTSATFKTTAGVNVRSSASINSNVLTTVARGSNVEVSEHDPAGWSRVRANGINGFIRSDFLTRGGDGSSGGSGGTSGGNGGAASPETVLATLQTTGVVNMRTGASTSYSIIRTLIPNTSVDVLGTQGDWSRVRHNGTNGFIRSDLISETGASSPAPQPPPQQPSQPPPQPAPPQEPPPVTVIETLKTVTDVNMRTGPSTSYDRIRLLPPNTSVDVTENHSNGWSSVIHNGTSGFIKSDLLSANIAADTVELIDWSVATGIVPTGVNLNVVDVRTGITFQLRGFAKSGHLDVEPPTLADTEAILRTRNGIWSWAARPVWVTVGNRTFAAALNGMPHDVSTIHTNGMDGHLCLHFDNTVTNSQSYQKDLRSAVAEAYNARPR